MTKVKLYNKDALVLLKSQKAKSVDMIFADPPYNLSGKNYLTCKAGKPVVCDKGSWDKIQNVHDFNKIWVKACIRLLKNDGTLWISGTLHNHPSIGTILKEMNMWIINDIIWYKPNAPPLMTRNRLVPSTELIWVASKSKKYFFNYDLAKKLNNGKQMRNLWVIPASRHITIHPTEKPENLLERIILIGSQEKSTILDPFMGSGTTGVVAKRLNRNFIGIEIDNEYFKIAKKRIRNTSEYDTLVNMINNGKDLSVSQLQLIKNQKKRQKKL